MLPSQRSSLGVALQEDVPFFVRRGFPTVMPRLHMHTDIELNFVLQGAMHYFANGQFHTIEAGALAVFWAGMPHALTRVEPSTECVWVVVPLTWFLQWQLPADFTQQLLKGVVVSARYDRDEERALERAILLRWVNEMAIPSSESQTIVLLETEALLRRFARQGQLGPQKRSGDFGGAMSQHVEALASYLSQNYQSEMTVAQIAGAVGLHPNYAMQVFKAGCGMSVWEYLLRLRVSHAQRLLLATDLKVSQVAIQAGFGSTTRFYEAFARYSGHSPGQFRRVHGL